MCDTCVPRSISPGQKRRYRPQTVKIRDLQDYYDKMTSVFKIIPLTKSQFCFSYCLFLFLFWPTKRSAPITSICHHYFVVHTLRLYFYSESQYLDQFTAHYRDVSACRLPFCQALILAILSAKCVANRVALHGTIL